MYKNFFKTQIIVKTLQINTNFPHSQYTKLSHFHSFNFSPIPTLHTFCNLSVNFQKEQKIFTKCIYFRRYVKYFPIFQMNVETCTNIYAYARTSLINTIKIVANWLRFYNYTFWGAKMFLI